MTHNFIFEFHDKKSLNSKFLNFLKLFTFFLLVAIAEASSANMGRRGAGACKRGVASQPCLESLLRS